jgi:hypothetical protein
MIFFFRQFFTNNNLKENLNLSAESCETLFGIVKVHHIGRQFNIFMQEHTKLLMTNKT